MYFKTIELDNVGPIDRFKLVFPFRDENPLPVILVGENGSGKSIVLSHLVNSLMFAKEVIYEDTEVDKEKVFKYRTPNYIRINEFYYRSEVIFQNNAAVREWELKIPRKVFEETLKYTPLNRDWNEIPEQDSSSLFTNFRMNKKYSEDIFSKNCCLYFPANRFEEPAWLNLDNLKSKSVFTQLKHIAGYSNRNIICNSPMRTNINWLLDLILDARALEMKVEKHNVIILDEQPQQEKLVDISYVQEGRANLIYNLGLKILNSIFGGMDNFRFGVGTRHFRNIEIMRDNRSYVQNLFNLSTGQSLILNMFMSILRDYDLSRGELRDIFDISGIVIIDEM